LYHLNGGWSQECLEVLRVLIERIHIKQGLLSTRYHESELPHGVWKEEAEAYFGSVICSIKWPQVFVLLRVLDGVLKGSLRSRNSVVLQDEKQITLPGKDVAALARDCFGWGGHRNAAGFKLPLEGDFTSHRERIFSKIRAALAV
jgi:hypothetical protein